MKDNKIVNRLRLVLLHIHVLVLELIRKSELLSKAKGWIKMHSIHTLDDTYISIHFMQQWYRHTDTYKCRLV